MTRHYASNRGGGSGVRTARRILGCIDAIIHLAAKVGVRLSIEGSLVSWRQISNAPTMCSSVPGVRRQSERLCELGERVSRKPAGRTRCLCQSLLI